MKYISVAIGAAGAVALTACAGEPSPRVVRPAPPAVYAPAPAPAPAPSTVYAPPATQPAYVPPARPVYQPPRQPAYTPPQVAAPVTRPSAVQPRPEPPRATVQRQPAPAPVAQAAPPRAPAQPAAPVTLQTRSYSVVAAEPERSETLERIASLGEPSPAPQIAAPYRSVAQATMPDGGNTAYPRPKPSKPGARATTAGEPLRVAMPRTPSRAYLGAGTPPTIEYNIPHLPQEEPLWCWAAAAQQAIGWVNNGRAPAQCAVVALAHGLSVEECCADRDGICARTGEIPAIGALVRKFGGQAYELASVPRTPEEVYDVLRGGGTLLIRLRPAPHDQAVGIRHMIVVRGIEWLRLPNNELQATLLYNDPLGEGQRAVSFNEIEGFFEQALMIKRS